MSVSVQAGTTLPFDRFWRWLKHHANCILRAGTSDAWLHDQEDFHWHLDEDESRNSLVQLLWGKLLVGELALPSRDVLFVQATPDPEATEPGPYLFEIVAGQGEPEPVFHFLLAHGFEEEAQHRSLKH